MKRVLIALGIVVAIFVLATIGGFFYFKARPLDSMVAMSRWSLARAGAVKKTVEVGGATVTYFVAGKGPNVVLVHGANDQAGLWTKAVKALAPEYRLIIPDLPGHGESGPGSGPLTYEQLVTALGAVIDNEAPGQKVVLAGNSMGGWISLLYATRHPERVSHLILEASAGLTLDAYTGPTLFPKNRAEAAKVLAAATGRSAAAAPDYLLDDLIRTAATSPAARLMKNDLRPYFLDGKLGSLGVPATLIWGANDGLLPVDYAKRLEKELPGSTLRVLPDCGHMPHYQCTAPFVEAFRSAIKGGAGASR